jgi:glycosyltransferase involved in cell wall biosynthesis
MGPSAVIKVTHVIAGLEADGAETVLHAVASRMDATRFQNEVISLTDLGPMAEALTTSGVPVRALGMRRGVPNPYQVLRLAKWLKTSRPQLVQTWMYHADLIGGLAAGLARLPVIWGIHHTNLDPGQNKRMTILTARICAQLSERIPRRIICCSEASRQAHVQFGYASQKLEVIPNGFDLTRFHPDAEARTSLRRELGLADGVPLVGMAARFHVQKDQRNFILAASHLHSVMPEVHFVLCGEGVDAVNLELNTWITRGGTGLEHVVHLLGSRKDMPRFFAALDVATSASLSEAFPMAVGEAMACSIPCVVTNVGDSAYMIGETGKVVPPSSPAALVNAWQELLVAGPSARQRLGRAARNRVEEKFGIAAIVARYQELYGQVVASPGSTAAQHSSVASLAG